jgi:ERCC4-type nuclease
MDARPPPPHSTREGRLLCMPRTRPATVQCPFTIVVDTNELLPNHKPFQFIGLRTNKDQGERPIIVNTIGLNLYVGDYSILGLPRIIIERKSLSDLFGSNARHDNFEERLAEMSGSAYDFAAVVIEAEYSTIMKRPPKYTSMLPKAVMRSILSWMPRYRVQWVPMPDRRAAEIATFRLLEFCWKYHGDKVVIPDFAGIAQGKGCV